MKRRTERPEGPPILHQVENINHDNDYLNQALKIPLQPPKTSFKGSTISSTMSFKSSSKASFRVLRDFYVKTIIKFWRNHTPATGYSCDDLYASTDDGIISKIWIPLPWWDNRGHYRVLELCFIHADNLFPDTKKHLLNRINEIKFFDPTRVDTWNVFMVYGNRSKVRATFYESGYIYLIKNDVNAVRHTLRFTINAINALHRTIQKPSAFLQPGPAEFLEISKEFVSVLNTAIKAETRLRNEAHYEAEREQERRELIEVIGGGY